MKRITRKESGRKIWVDTMLGRCMDGADVSSYFSMCSDKGALNYILYCIEVLEKNSYTMYRRNK